MAVAYMIGAWILMQEERRAAQVRTREVIERRSQTRPDDARALWFGAGNLFEMGHPEKGMQWVEQALAAD